MVEKDNMRMRIELKKLTETVDEKGKNELGLKMQSLTARQLEIVELVRKGKTNKEIGLELFISENTVKYHLKAIYEILDIENRFELK